MALHITINGCDDHTHIFIEDGDPLSHTLFQSFAVVLAALSEKASHSRCQPVIRVSDKWCYEGEESYNEEYEAKDDDLR